MREMEESEFLQRAFVAIVLIVAAWLVAGCSPLRHYKFASHGPGDTSAGDLTQCERAWGQGCGAQES